MDNSQDTPLVAADDHRHATRSSANLKLRGVARGLDLVYWGIALIAVSLILIGIMPYLSSSIPVPTILSILKVLLLGILAGALLGLIGRILCLNVPSESGGKPFVASSLVCDGLSLAATAALLLGATPGALLAFGQNIIPVAGALLFLLFLKRTASFIGGTELVRRAQSLFVFVLVIAVAGTVLTLYPALLSAQGLILAVVILLFCLVTFLRYIRLLYDLRRAILQAIA